MRRMMHAAVLVFAISSVANANPPQLRRIPALPTANAVPVSNQTNSPSDQTAPIAEPVPAQQNPPAQLINYGMPTPHSQLGIYMQCTDYSPNLWACYGAQRAAEQQRINRHVDGQCDCLKGARRLHHHACDCNGHSGCGDCSTGCSTAKAPCINRYKLGSMSTLYDQPSSGCGSIGGCKLGSGTGILGHGKWGSACETSSCGTSSCGSALGGVLYGSPSTPCGTPSGSPCASLSTPTGSSINTQTVGVPNPAGYTVQSTPSKTAFATPVGLQNNKR